MKEEGRRATITKRTLDDIIDWTQIDLSDEQIRQLQDGEMLSWYTEKPKKWVIVKRSDKE